MNKELIEKMKNNRVSNYLLEDDEFRCLENAGMENREWKSICTDKWEKDQNTKCDRYNLFVYRIRADYQPPVEDEFERVKITCVRGAYCIDVDGISWHATSAPCFPGFAGYLHPATEVYLNGYKSNQYFLWTNGQAYSNSYAETHNQESRATHVLFRRPG